MNTPTENQSASSSSVPPPGAPASVLLAQQAREALTDLAGVILAGYLAQARIVSGEHALVFAAILLLPSPLLARLSKLLTARGRISAALVLLGAAALWTRAKTVLLGAASVAAISSCL